MMYEVRHIDENKGKGLFATQFIAAGTTICEEDPLVSAQFAWNTLYGYRACHHCLRPLETAEENVQRLAAKPILLPHPECCTTNQLTITECQECGVQFCSAECKQKAEEQYHRILCTQTKSEDTPLHDLMNAWRSVHYPPETSTILIIPRIIATILQSKDREATLQTFLKFQHKSINEESQLVHKMIGKTFEEQRHTLLECLKCAVPHEGIEQLLTPDGFISLLALIGTNGQGVGTSALSQWVQKVLSLSFSDEEKDLLNAQIDKIYDAIEEQSGMFLNNEGVALYALQSACNHSCEPNAEVSFQHNNHRLSLVALKDIQANEEICTSYLDDCILERSRHTRQKQLKENYLFLCQCIKCLEQADEPDITSEEEMEEENEMSS